MKIIRVAQRNIELPSDRIPSSTTEYIRSATLVYTEGRSNKEYIVLIYQYPDGQYSVVAWNGRIGGTLQMQPKYFGRHIDTANAIFFDTIASKRSKGYWEVQNATLSSYLGIPSASRATPRSTPKSQPSTAPIATIPPEKTIKDAPTKEEEIPIENRGILDLLTSTNNWYKRSQIRRG